MSAQLIKVYNVYDESLNQAHSKSYRLSIQLSQDGFSFAIFDTLNSRFVSLESSELSGYHIPEDFVAIFDDFTSQHPWLKSEFESVTVMFEPQYTTLVPLTLFHDEDAEDIARFNFKLPDKAQVVSEKLVNADAQLIYCIPDAILNLLDTNFPGHKLTSHAAVLIESLLIHNKNQSPDKRLFVNVRNAQLDIALVSGKQLIFYNSFRYHSKQDFIYYIIFVFEQLNLNPEEIELTFSGKIDKNSTLFDIAWKYVRHINFQALPSAYRYSYVYKDIPKHYFYTLLNLGICES